jgi:hypothetical protein
MICNATLDGYTLPSSFSYDPYVPRIRRTFTPTAKAVIHQSANPSIVHGDGIINWTLNPAYPNEWDDLFKIYQNDALVRFVGYWGDEYDVYFQLDQNRPRNALFNASGSMIVVCVVTLASPAC